MIKFYAVLFIFSLFITVFAEKDDFKPDDKVDSIENTATGPIEVDSESIEVVQRGADDDKLEEPFNYDHIQEEDNRSGGIEDTNSTDVPKFEQFFDGAVSDNSDEYVHKLIPEHIEVDTESNDAKAVENESSTQQEDIETVYEHTTHTQAPDIEDLGVHDEESSWRSAEHLHDIQKDFSNEDASLDTGERGFSGEDYGDKKIASVKGRMDTPKSEIKEHRPLNMRRYGPHDDGSMLDAMGMRSISEIMIPRYRPTLTRNGIVYTPTLYTVQTASPHMDLLPGRNWVPNRSHFTQEREVYSRPRSRGLPHHHTDSKIIDDYNDYGTNTYSYTPVAKRTTQAPATHTVPPHNFDVFHKLVEASNQPSLSKHSFNDNMYVGNYYPQHQFTDNYRPYDVRRLRRDSWDERSFPNF